MRKIVLAASSFVLAASSAIAQPPVVVTGEPAPIRVVSYDDLNLDSKAGQTKLVNRIRGAASDLCFESGREDVEFTMARRSCYRTALSGGLDQMNRAIAARASGATLAAATLTIRGE